MVVDEVLTQETGYAPGQNQQDRQQAAAQNQPLNAFMDPTKGDVEFWIQLLQLLVLIMILREVSA